MRLLALLLAVAAAAGPSRARAEIVDAVAVVVNGEVITLSELEERLGRALPPPGGENDRRRKGLLKQAADQAVAELLVEKEAKEEGLLPTETEIDNAIENVKRAQRIDDATLEKALEYQGLSMPRYRELIHAQLTRLKVIEMKVRSRVNVSDDDVKARYAKLVGDVKTEEELHLRDIIVPKEGDAAAARVKAEAARARVLAGEAFAKVAAESGGPLASSGGDFGWVKKGMVLAELESVAFALEKGKPSEVLDAGGNLHVLYVEDRRRSGGAKTLAEAREELREQLYSERLEKATDDYVGELRRDAAIEYRLP